MARVKTRLLQTSVTLNARSVSRRLNASVTSISRGFEEWVAGGQPGPSTPVLIDAYVLNATPTILTLEYSDVVSLNGLIVPATTDFSINGISNPVTAVAISGLFVNLTLTNAILFSTSAFTVSYTQGTNKIQNINGGLAASFVNEPVTNNVSAGTALLISGTSLDILNRHLFINFDPNVYHSSVGGLLASDLTLSQTGSAGFAITSITNSAGGALVGGETQIKVNLSFSSNPTGTETIEIKPSAAGSYRDNNNNFCSPNDSTGTITMWQEFDPWYKAVILAELTAVETPPSADQRYLENAFFVTGRSVGWLTENDGLHLASLSFDHVRYNFATGLKTATIVGTPLLTPYLGQRGAAASYIDFNWNCATHGVKHLQNDRSFVIKITNTATSAAMVFGARGTGGGVNFGHTRLLARNTSDQAAISTGINNAGNELVVASVTSSIHTYHGSRNAASGANAVQLYVDGVLAGSDTDTSSTPTTRDYYGNAENPDDGAPTVNTTQDVLLWMWGSNLRTHAASIHTAANALASGLAALIPTLNVRLYLIIGQSIADRAGLVTEDTSTIDPYNNQLPDPNLLVYWDGEIAELESGVNGVDKSGGGTWWGHIYALATLEKAKHPTEKLLFIHQAVGGTSMKNVTGSNIWLPGGAVSSQYETMIREYDEVSLLVSSVINYEKVIWIQGHSDATYLNFGNGCTLSAVNGATSMSTSAAHTIAVGRPILIKGVAYTTVAGTTGSTLVIERAYEGITETVSNGVLLYDRGDADDYGPINMRGKTVFSNSATLSAVNGQTSMTTSAAHGVSVNNWVQISSEWYRAVTGTTGSTLVIDRAYEGATATVPNASLYKAAASGGANNELTMITGIRNETAFNDFIVIPPQKGSLPASTYLNLSAVRAQKVQNELDGNYGTTGLQIFCDNETTFPFRPTDNPHMSNVGAANMAIEISNEL